MKSFALWICAVLISAGLHAQVTGAKYKIEYNGTTCRYDIFLVPDGGSATSQQQTITRTSRVSLVMPTGTVVGVQTPNEPRSTVNASPIPWDLRDYYTGAMGFGGQSDLLAFDVNTSSTTFPSITSTTPILLFSLQLTLPANNLCGDGVRLWRNNSANGNTMPNDPTSAAIGNLTDYNNSFKIGTNTNGGNTEKFTGLVAGNTSLPLPVITSIQQSCTPNSFTLTASATATCGVVSSYTWTGPSGFVSGPSANPSFTITNPTPANVGQYNLVVKTNTGCSQTASQNVMAVTCTPLSSTLTAFTAQAVGCAARIEWKMPANAAAAVQMFEVQQSVNGVNFETVGSVDPTRGNEAAFSYTHQQGSDKAYYRLRILNKSREGAFSSVVPVVTDCKSVEIALSPNPTTGIATLSGVKAGDKIKVTDAAGKVLAVYPATGSAVTVDLSAFAQGVYSVVVTRDTQRIKTVRISKR